MILVQAKVREQTVDGPRDTAIEIRPASALEALAEGRRLVAELLIAGATVQQHGSPTWGELYLSWALFEATGAQYAKVRVVAAGGRSQSDAA